MIFTNIFRLEVLYNSVLNFFIINTPDQREPPVNKRNIDPRYTFVENIGDVLGERGAGKIIDYFTSIHFLGYSRQDCLSGLGAISSLLNNLVSPQELYNPYLTVINLCGLFAYARESVLSQQLHGRGYAMGLLNPEEAITEINNFLGACKETQELNRLPDYSGFQRFGLVWAYIQRMDNHMKVEAGVGLERNPTMGQIFYPVKEDEVQSASRVKGVTARAINAGNTLVNVPYNEKDAENDRLLAEDLSILMENVFFGEADGNSIGLCKRFGLPLGDKAISVRITRSGTGGSFGGLELSILQELLAETDAHADAYKILRNTMWGLNIPNGIIVNSMRKDRTEKDMKSMLATAVEEVIQLRISPIMIATYGDLGAFYIEEALVHELLCRFWLKKPEDVHSTPRNIPNIELIEKELQKFLQALELSDQEEHPGTSINLFFEIAQITKAFREEHPDFLPFMKKFIDTLLPPKKSQDRQNSHNRKRHRGANSVPI